MPRLAGRKADISHSCHSSSQTTRPRALMASAWHSLSSGSSVMSRISSVCQPFMSHRTHTFTSFFTSFTSGLCYDLSSKFWPRLGTRHIEIP